MILGGLIGLGLAYLKVPVYEATAFVQVAFDSNRSLPITSVRRTQGLDQVRALILADDTLLSAMDIVEASEDIGSSMRSPGEFRSLVKLGQSETGFALSVYRDNPDWAAASANAWAQASIEALKEASIHAIKAAELQAQIYQLGCRLELIGGEEESRKAVWECEPALGDLEPENLPQELVSEVIKSRGIVPALTFSLAQTAEAPTQPIRWARGGLILAGAVLGLFIGIIAIIATDKSSVSSDVRN
jgi:hypothetical protein